MTVVETVLIHLGVILGADVNFSRLWAIKSISLKFIPFVVNVLAV